MFDLTNPIFQDADKARAHLESINWPEGPYCPHCGECENVHRLQGKSHRAGLIQCNSCLKNFTVTVGTVFERSKVPLNKWLLANHLLCASKKGMSAAQIARMLGVTYKTAWFMAHRLRHAMASDGFLMSGAVEVDETYVGGKRREHYHSRSKQLDVAQARRAKLEMNELRRFRFRVVHRRKPVRRGRAVEP